jgi:hypothetical protein
MLENPSEGDQAWVGRLGTFPGVFDFQEARFEQKQNKINRMGQDAGALLILREEAASI